MDSMLRNQTRKKGAINAPRHIVSRGNRKKRTSVIIETDSVVEAGGLRGVFTKTHYAFGTVMEPPCGTEPETGIMSGKRGKFTAVGRFIEGEQNDSESRFIPEAVQQWFQRPHKVGRHGDVRADIPSESPE